MRALIVYKKAGEAQSVESGNLSVLAKKVKGLASLPKGVDELELWDRSRGRVRTLSKRKLDAKLKAIKSAKEAKEVK